MSRWPPHRTKVMPRIGRTVRFLIRLSPRNKALRGRSAAMTDLPIGCKSLEWPTFKLLLRLTSLRLCSNGGNALMLPSRRLINSTSNAKMRNLMEESVLMGKHIKVNQSTRKAHTWGLDRWKKFMLPKITSLLLRVLPKLAVINLVSESRTDHMVCRKFSRFTNKKATNQKHFLWLLVFLIITWCRWEFSNSGHLMCSTYRWSVY